MAETIYDLVQRSEYLVAKSDFPQFLPYLFNRVHLRRIWGNMKEDNVIWHLKRLGLVPCSSIATKQNNVLSIPGRELP
jgi:hypothetical protein